MSTTDNKIKYNLKNVTLFPCTETLDDSTGEYSYTYGDPVKLPGAVSLSMEPQGDVTKFYADGVEYYISNSNNGYEGDLEVALILDAILQAFLGMKKDSKGVIYEIADGSAAPNFALAFEFDGDKKAIRHIFYLCSMTRPKIEGNTKEETIEPKTETSTITALPRKDNGLVKAKTGADTDATSYSSWYSSVYVPTIE